MSNRTITIILVSFFILLSAGFMTWFYGVTRETPKTLAVIGRPGHKVLPFSFVNQDGKTITNKDVAGKVYVVNYFFTTCKGICPKMNENLNLVYRAFKGNNDFMILSHSVDPELDSVPAMKAYSLRYEADPKQWMFLTGDKKALYDAAFDSYLVTAVDSTRPASVDEEFIHDQHLILVDRTGHIRSGLSSFSAYDGMKKDQVDSLISDIKILLAEKQ